MGFSIESGSVHCFYWALAFPDVTELYGESKRVHLLIVWVCLSCYSDRLRSCLLAKIERGWGDLRGRDEYLEVAYNWTLDQPNQAHVAGYLPSLPGPCLQPSQTQNPEDSYFLFLVLWYHQGRLSDHLKLNSHIPFPKEEKKTVRSPHLLELKIFEIHIFSS